VLKYGFLTINGSTGGWRVEASTTLARSVAAVTIKGRIGAMNGSRQRCRKNTLNEIVR
jgi:hypothetical protein